LSRSTIDDTVPPPPAWRTSSGKRKGLADARRILRVGAHHVLERHEDHHARAHPRAVIAKHRVNRCRIVRRDRLAECEIRGEDRRALLEPRLVLREEPLEDALALLERLVDGLPGDLRVRLDDEEGGETLHQDEERHEEDHDARPEARQPRFRAGLGRRRGS
jgi:hypothetical protein